jgi:hypothetical protein
MLALAVVAFVLVFRLRLGILPLLGITATIGALWVLWAT